MPPTKRKTPGKAEQARRKNQVPLQAPNQSAQPEHHAAPSLGRGGGWHKGDANAPHELKLPSGSTCLVITPGLPSLIASGVIEKMDMLTPVVDEKLVKRARGRQKRDDNELDFNSMKPEQLLAAFEMADRVTAAVVVDPPVRLAPMPRCTVCDWEGVELHEHRPADGHIISIEPRDPDVFYTDGIDIGDKMHILNEALGGLRGLESFRRESDESVANVAAVEDVEDNSG